MAYQSSIITAYVDVTKTSIRNPTITVDSNKVGVLFYLSSTDMTTNQRTLATADLTFLGPGNSRTYCYTVMRLTLINAYFIKTDRGEEQILEKPYANTG